MEVNISDIRTLRGKQITNDIQDTINRGWAIKYNQKYYLFDGACRVSRELEKGKIKVDIQVIPLWVIAIFIILIIVYKKNVKSS